MSRRKHELNLQPGFDPLDPAHTSDPACWITGASADALRYGVTGNGGTARRPETGVWDLTQGLIDPLKTLPPRTPKPTAKPVIRSKPAPTPASAGETRWQRARRLSDAWIADAPALAALALDDTTPAFAFALPDGRALTVQRLIQWRNNEDSSTAARAAGVRFQIEIALRRAFELFPLVTSEPLLIAPSAGLTKLPAYTCVAGVGAVDTLDTLRVCIWFQPVPGLPDTFTRQLFTQRLPAASDRADLSFVPIAPVAVHGVVATLHAALAVESFDLFPLFLEQHRSIFESEIKNRRRNSHGFWTGEVLSQVVADCSLGQCEYRESEETGCVRAA